MTLLVLIQTSQNPTGNCQVLHIVGCIVQLFPYDFRLSKVMIERKGRLKR